MLELYHWEPTLDSGEPLVALKEKALPFRAHYVDLAELQQHQPGYLRLNPSGQVPVLVHDGRVITEAGLILEYLEDAFPERPLRPAELAGRYRVRFWIKYAEERVAPYAALLGWLAIGRPALTAAAVEQARQSIRQLPAERRQLWEKALAGSWSEEEIVLARASLSSAVRLIEQTLREAPYLAGDTYSIADIALVFIVRALRTAAPEIASAERAPATLGWLGRLEGRPAVAETLALARTSAPERAFAPGPEPARWG
jgi:glutathione S-transferase